MSNTSVAADEKAAGHERISPRPMTPTAAIATAIGTRRAMSTNIAAKPSSPSSIAASAQAFSNVTGARSGGVRRIR